MSDPSLHENLRAAIRQHLLTVQKAATAVLTVVAVSGSTYTRQTGSFIADKFGVGDEVMAAGFTKSGNNGRSLITGLTATAMTVDRVLATEAAGASVQLIAGLPQGRAFQGWVYTPIVGQPYISERMLPISDRVVAVGSGAEQEHIVTGNFVLRYPANTGTLAAGKIAGAIRTHFKPGTSLVYGGTVGLVMQAELRPSYEDPEWLHQPVIVTVRAGHQ
jgi:hypothetical protein